MSQTSASAKRRMRRIPDENRKRNTASCDFCRKRRCKCVASPSGQGCVSCEQHHVTCSYTTPRKTRFYGSLDELSDRYRCLEAIVKGAFPNDDVATAAELLELGQRMGYTMPDLGDEDLPMVKLEDLIRVPPGTSLPTPHTPESNSSIAHNSAGRVSGNDAPDQSEMGPSRTRSASEEPHVSLIRDTSGNEHYIGPSGTLNFLSQLRKLVDADTAANPGTATASCPAGASKFAQDDTAQALEADEEHHDKPDESTIPVATSIIPEHVVPSAPSQDGASPGSITTAIARDFTHLPSADMDEVLRQFPPDEILEMLIQNYFKNVHGDFPLFHRATFEDEYEVFVVQARRRPPGQATRGQRRPMPDWGWIGCLHMIIVFGSISNPMIAGVNHSELRRRSVMAVRMLLPQFISKCTLTNVRVLLLLSLFLHNNNERNAAWNLVGTATRVSFALGLHRSSMLSSYRPLEREVRKWVFCTLYSFEQFLASSLGRPSGLQELDVEIVPPREGFLDGGSGTDAQLVSLSLKLQAILSKTRLLHIGKNKSMILDTTLSPPATDSVLSSLDDWKKEIAQHAGFDIPWIKTGECFLDDSSATDMQQLKVSLSWKTRAQLRAVLLLHIQFHYVAIVATRPLLLRDIALMRTESSSTSTKRKLSAQSETCVKHACQLAHLVVLLDSFEIINGLSGLDVFYAYCAAMVLILRLFRIAPANQNQEQQQSQEQQKEDNLQAAIRTLVSKVQEVINKADKGGSMKRFARVVDTFFDVVNKPNPRFKGPNGHPAQLQQAALQPQHLQYIQHQQHQLPGPGLMMDPEMLMDQPMGGTPRFSETAPGDHWLNFLPLSTFGGSGAIEGLYQYESPDSMNPHDWMDMQILLGAYGSASSHM